MIKTVIDTNVLVSALSSKSVYHWLIESLLGEQFKLFITGEILLEYEEILKSKYSETVASIFFLRSKICQMFTLRMYIFVGTL